MMLILLLAGALLAACGPAAGELATAGPDPVADPEPDPEPVETEAVEDSELVVYSGRSEELIGPILERFETQTGVRVAARYGSTAEMAATILEEGGNSPADVYIAQDAGALGALASEGVLSELPGEILDRVEPRFRSPESFWVGLSGRARVVAYNTGNVDAADLPGSVIEFTDPVWKGRIGWAPTNGSFQAFITAMRLLHGEEAAREWLEGIIANEPIAYPDNATALRAVAAGEVNVAFINHYYLFQAQEQEGEDFGAANYFLPGGDVGALVNVAGAGILTTSERREAAERLIAFLLSDEAQRYFADETFEYPLVAGIDADPRLPALADIQTPDLDLTDLEDLQGTLQLLQEVGAME
jgi:iron(III) transport system substrate-binding protein